MNWFPQYNYILASQSPRRKQLLEMLGVIFRIQVKEVDENYPASLTREEIPVFLSQLKAKVFQPELKNCELLITADTIVWLDGEVLGKPKNYDDAWKMLQKLSGKKHQVISGVSLTSSKKQTSFYDISNVCFKKLQDKEIEFYLKTCKPYDKAGSYGIQEWIGTIGITSIEGSFYNVMGLPIQKLYEEIQGF